MSTVEIQDQLARRIAAIERKHAGVSSKFEIRVSKTVEEVSLTFDMGPRSGLLATGLEEMDAALGGGLRPGLHEWYGAKERQQGNEATRQQRKKVDNQITKSNKSHQSFNRQSTIGNRQFFPLCLLVHLAWQALEKNPARWVIWIGERCFPYPAVLVRNFGCDLRLLRRSLFVRAESPAERVWVADLSIRCGLAGAVIADGAGLDMAATRQLQLSAGSQQAFVFLARPPQDLDRLSAASTRWMVRMERQQGNKATRQRGGLAISPYRHITISPNSSVNTCSTGTLPHYPMTTLPNPQWSLELLRCKGMQPATSRPVWLVEWNRVTNAIGVPAQVCDCVNDQARRHEGEGDRRGSPNEARRAQG